MAERRVAALADIPDQGTHPVEIDGTKIVLVRLGSEVHALAGECPHAGAPLHEGAICNGRLICPWHSGTFEVATGALVEPPPMTPLARFACRVAGGDVLLDPTPIPPPAPTQRDPADGRNFLLIGSGAASAMAAFSLREFGFTGRIVMIGPPPRSHSTARCSASRRWPARTGQRMRCRCSRPNRRRHSASSASPPA